MITFGLSIEARTGGSFGMEDWWRKDWGLGWIQFMLGKEGAQKTLLLARLLASPCGEEAEGGRNLLISLVPEQV